MSEEEPKIEVSANQMDEDLLKQLEAMANDAVEGAKRDQEEAKVNEPASAVNTTDKRRVQGGKRRTPKALGAPAVGDASQLSAKAMVAQKLGALEELKEQLLKQVRSRGSAVKGSERVRFVSGINRSFNDVFSQIQGKEVDQQHVTLLDSTIATFKDEAGKLGISASEGTASSSVMATPEPVAVEKKRQPRRKKEAADATVGAASDEKRFAALVEVLRKKSKPFGKDKDGKELVIEEVGDDEIKFRYGGILGRMRPKNVGANLQFLEDHFSWTLREKKEKKVPLRGRKAQDILDKDDASREALLRKNGKNPDLDERRYLERMNRAKEVPPVVSKPVAPAAGEPAFPEPFSTPTMPVEEVPIPKTSAAELATPVSEVPKARVEFDFEALERNLEEARNNYAKHDFENSSKLRKLSAFFRLDKSKYEGLDVDGAKEKYNEAFQALLNARLANIRQKKEDGEIDDEQYRLEMGQELTAFEYEGRVKVFQARQQVKMESLATSMTGRIAEAIPRLAHWYNKQNKWVRLSLGVALGVGATLTAPVSGVAVTAGTAAAATWIAIARGTVGGLGMFATVDSGLEAVSDTRAKSAAEKSGGRTLMELEDLEEEGRTPEEIAAAKEQFLQEKLVGLHRHFENRKRGMMLRKSAAVLAGVAFGSAVGSGWLGEKIKGLTGKIGEWFGNVGDAAQHLTSSTFEVHSGDTTWKLLGEYLKSKDVHFSSLNPAQQTYAIDALKDKLAAMSPTDLKAVGFGSGDISQLAIGDHINFDKVVGNSVADALKGASSLSQEAIGSITHNNATILEWSKAHPGVKLTDPLIESILHGNGAEAVPGKAASIVLDAYNEDPLGSAAAPAGVESISAESAPVAPSVSDATPVSDAPPVTVEASTDTGLVYTSELKPRVDDWYMQIFRTTDEQDWVYDKAKLLKVPIYDIYQDVRNHTALTGLSSEQTKNFVEFMGEARKATGGSGENLMKDLMRTNPHATVEDFLKKVAPLVSRGTRLGLYTTTH